MINIYELNASLKGSAALERSEDNCIYLERTIVPENIPGLSPEQTLQIRKLLDYVDELVPDDFDFGIHLGGDKPIVSLEYSDGVTSGSMLPLEFNTNDEFYDELVNRNWDNERQKHLSGSQMWDVLLEEANSRPSRRPSLKTVRRYFRDEIRNYHKAMRKEQPPFSFLVTEQAEDGGRHLISYEMPNSVDKLIEHLSNTVSYEYQLVSVCIDGKPLAIEEVDKIAKQALKDMPPISRAMAEGRWPYDFMNMGGFSNDSDI